MIRIIVILFLLNINCLYSQSNEGEIEDAQILIEKNSKIILPKVDKSINKISLENKTISKKTFEFESIKFVDFSSKKKIDKILRDNTSYKETKIYLLMLKEVIIQLLLLIQIHTLNLEINLLYIQIYL